MQTCLLQGRAIMLCRLASYSVNLNLRLQPPDIYFFVYIKDLQIATGVPAACGSTYLAAKRTVPLSKR